MHWLKLIMELVHIFVLAIFFFINYKKGFNNFNIKQQINIILPK